MQDSTRIKTVLRVGQACGLVSLIAAGLVGLAVSAKHSILWVLLSVVVAYLATRLILALLVIGPVTALVGRGYGKQVSAHRKRRGTPRYP